MSAEENKELHLRFYEAYNRKDLQAVGELLANDFVAHFGNAALNRESYFGFVNTFFAAFPDLQNTVEEQVAEGDRVSTLSTWRGTHQAEFLGVSPTGKQITFTAFGLSRFADGKIAEHTFLGDMLGVLQQFGAVPSSGESEEAPPPSRPG
jgi:steroid delta-isomerase-like uncharacterized protein